VIELAWNTFADVGHTCPFGRYFRGHDKPKRLEGQGGFTIADYRLSIVDCELESAAEEFVFGELSRA
jgi:hypothetical protein